VGTERAESARTACLWQRLLPCQTPDEEAGPERGSSRLTDVDETESSTLDVGTLTGRSTEGLTGNRKARVLTMAVGGPSAPFFHALLEVSKRPEKIPNGEEVRRRLKGFRDPTSWRGGAAEADDVCRDEKDRPRRNRRIRSATFRGVLRQHGRSAVDPHDGRYMKTTLELDDALLTERQGRPRPAPYHT